MNHVLIDADSIVRFASSVPFDDVGDLTLIETEDLPVCGQIYKDEQFVDPPAPPPPPPVVPEAVSRRQFFQQLAIDGDITEDEALDAAVGTALPMKITDAIGSLPKEQQFAAKMLLRSAASFERSHPMTPVLGTVLKKDGPALDALWAAAFAI